MFALLRLLLLIFIVMTVVYIALSRWSRRVRRRRLTEDWTPQDGDLEAYLARGLDAYDHSLRRKLILGVYILPLCLIGVIVYLTNFQ